MMRTNTRILFCSFLSAAVIVAAAVGVSSQVRSLAGQSLHTPNVTPSSSVAPYSLQVNAQCDPAKQAGAINYVVTGEASGPYPGTYSEQGFYRLSGGKVVELSATFSVTPRGGGEATVTGNKTLPAGGDGVTGYCAPEAAGGTSTVLSGLFSYTASLSGSSTAGVGDMVLDAVISDGGASGFAHTDFYGDGKATGGGHILKSPANPAGVTFGFTAQLGGSGLTGNGMVQDHGTRTRIKMLNVLTFASDGVNAVFTGRAEVNGVEQNYRVEVKDVTDPGAGHDNFKIVTDTFTTSGVLTGGNVQVSGVAAVGPTATPTSHASPTPTPTPTPIPD